MRLGQQESSEDEPQSLNRVEFWERLLTPHSRNIMATAYGLTIYVLHICYCMLYICYYIICVMGWLKKKIIRTT